MKQKILWIMVALIVMSVPAMAAKVVNLPIPHENLVYQAYCGSTCPDAGNCIFGLDGFDTCGGDVISAVPGVLAIDPGGPQWPNFVSATQAVGTPVGPIAYTVTNVSMHKTVPTYVCTVPIGGGAVNQQGSGNIRLWWPLMYELPGTKWDLIITYKTANWNDGFNGNKTATSHQDEWIWTVDANLVSLGNLIDLFHELPAGSCQVPLINGKSLYESLADGVSDLKVLAADTSNPDWAQNLSDALNAFILLIEDNCLEGGCDVCPGQMESGIRNSLENPACCKLQADAEFILDEFDVNLPSK